jgi:hypothetical protein
VLNRDRFFAFLGAFDPENAKRAESSRQGCLGDNARFSRPFTGLFFQLHRKQRL